MDHEASETTLRFVGTATTLLDLGPFTVLTDPNFLHRGERAYLGKGLFSRRLTEPALQPEDLPRLDGLLLSHLHGDHSDRTPARQEDVGGDRRATHDRERQGEDQAGPPAGRHGLPLGASMGFIHASSK